MWKTQHQCCGGNQGGMGVENLGRGCLKENKATVMDRSYFKTDECPWPLSSVCLTVCCLADLFNETPA